MDDHTVHPDPNSSTMESSPGIGYVPPRTGEGVSGAARRAVLAGLGAVACAFDTAGDTFGRLVERGEQVQSDLSERVDEVREQNVGARDRARDYYRSAMDALLERANLPSRGDLETINVKLNIVSRKLDDLTMDRVVNAGGEPPASTPTSPPIDDPSSAT